MNYQKTFEQEVLAYAKKHGPKEWHSIGCQWSYVFGNEPIKWIVTQKETYLATILELYWDTRIENYLGIREVPTSTKDELKFHAEIMKLIETNIQNPDYYQDAFFAFEYKPDRYDLSKTKHPIPDRLKQSTQTQSDEERPEYFYDGAPDEVFDRIMKPEIERVEKTPLSNHPKYWVFSSASKSYRNQDVSPKVVAAEFGNTKITDDKNVRELVYAMHSAKPGPDKDYTYSFQIDKRWPTYDVYAVGYGRGGEIYSERTVAIFEKFKVGLRKFPVKFIDKDGTPVDMPPYFLLKLVEPYLDALEDEASLFTGSYSIGVKRIILDGEKTNNEPIFVLKKLFCTLMRDDLVQEIFKEKITGFWFVEAENWHSGKFGNNFSENSLVTT